MQNEKIDSIVELAANLASKADQLDQVLIIYRNKDDDAHGSMDNGLRLDESLWLVEAFKFWLQAGAIGLLKERHGE